MGSTPRSPYLPDTTISQAAVGACSGGFAPIIDPTVIPAEASEIEVDVAAGKDYRVQLWDVFPEADDFLNWQTFESGVYKTTNTDYIGGWYRTLSSGYESELDDDASGVTLAGEIGFDTGEGISLWLEVYGAADANVKTALTGSFVGKDAASATFIGSCEGQRTDTAVCTKFKIFWIGASDFVGGYYQIYERAGNI